MIVMPNNKNMKFVAQVWLAFANALTILRAQEVLSLQSSFDYKYYFNEVIHKISILYDLALKVTIVPNMIYTVLLARAIDDTKKSIKHNWATKRLINQIIFQSSYTHNI